MKNESKATTKATYNIERAPKQPYQPAVWQGTFHIQHFNKDGEFLGEWESKNGITNEGVQYLLNLGLNPDGSETQASNWYMSIFGTGETLADTDGGGSHAGWTETSGTTRVEWVLDDISGTSRQISNSATVDIVIPTVATDTLIGGIFIIDNLTSDTASQTIFSTTAFTTDPTVNTGDTLKVTYTVGIAAT